jgi:hypothetical protein
MRDTNKKINEQIQVLSQGDTTEAQRKARQKVIEDDIREDKQERQRENVEKKRERQKQTMPLPGADSPFSYSSFASSPYNPQQSSSYIPPGMQSSSSYIPPGMQSSSSYNIPSFFPGAQSSLNEGGVFEIGDYDLDDIEDKDFDYFD